MKLQTFIVPIVVHILTFLIDKYLLFLISNNYLYLLIEYHI